MMADAYLTDQSLLAQNPEALDLSRQRKLADMLTSQMFNQPQGNMVSGYYVKPSWTQQLAPLASGIAGQAMNAKLDEKQLALAEALRAKKSEEMSTFQELMSSPETRPQAIQYAAKSQTLQPLVAELMKPQKLGAEESIVIPNIGGGEPINLATGAAKKTTDQRDYELAKSQGFQGSFLDFQMALKRAGASNISVNTGQHGFDNALKLRSDFRSEPVYKAFEEVKAAKNQIDQAAKMASPAGDLAAATKVMKILDPTSVVRESELGMAMAATGVEDKVRNYANMVITGQKLTPAQRKDFVDLSDKLYNVAGQQFNQKRNEYAGIAERNKLDVEAAVGAPAKVKGTGQVKFLGFE
jgi:hypothetical protein